LAINTSKKQDANGREGMRNLFQSEFPTEAAHAGKENNEICTNNMGVFFFRR